MRKKRMPAGKFYGKASKFTVDYFKKELKEWGAKTAKRVATSTKITAVEL